MNEGNKVFITDCEGPISKNDNAFELTRRFIPNGDYFFAILSQYDDVLAEIIKKPGYKAGNTLKLITPFLRAYGLTNKKMIEYSIRNILLVKGADETLRFVRSIMPSFIVSTSYEQYISALCDAIEFPKEKVYCTKFDIDKYDLERKEISKLKKISNDITKMLMMEIPNFALSIDDFNEKSRDLIKKLDDIFWEEIQTMKAGRMLNEVSPIGGYEKANAVNDIVKQCRTDLSNVIYFGDSITDVESFKLVKNGGGLAVSFNGNNYAIKEAEIAVMANHTIIISIISEIFNNFGKEKVIQIINRLSPSSLKNVCSFYFNNKLKNLNLNEDIRVEIITTNNVEKLIKESSIFRKLVRGNAIGNLG
jgi:energy-converting hydrogenase A subunit R